jgi:DNA primase
VDFLEERVLPALGDGLDAAFPEFDFRPGRSGWWVARREPSGYEEYGAREGKLTATARGFRTFKAGRPFVSWTAYVSNGAVPTGADFVTAVRTLAGRAGVDASALDRPLTPEEAERHEQVERRRTLLETFVAQAQHALRGDSHQAEVARDYLCEKRGFSKDELAALPFGLYSAPADVEAQLVDAGFTADEVARSGLLRDGRWEGRLVLPWRDRRGHVATVVARDVTGTAEEGAKYLYLADAKKPVAFGLDVALLPKAGGRDHLVLVEGLLDVVALQHGGFHNVAALGGDGRLLTAERWDALASFGVKQATLVLDNDRKPDGSWPGREGTVAALHNAGRAEAAPEVWVVDPAELGEAKDPDELVRRESLAAFKAVLERRVLGNVYRGRVALGDVTPLSPDHERRDAADRVVSLVNRLRGPRAALDSEDLLRLAAERTGYTSEGLADVAQGHKERQRREKAEAQLRRKLRETQDGLAAGQDVDTLTAGLVADLADLRAQAQTPPPAFSVERLLAESAKLPQGKSSGWAALDKLGVSFNAGELAYLAARTGHGKTSALVGLLGNWLWAPDAAADELLLFYSAEEPEVRIFHRLLSLLTVAKAEDRPNSWWTTNEIRAKLQGAPSPAADGCWPSPDALEAAQAQLCSWEDRLLVVHRPAWSVDELEAHARSLAAGRTVGAVMVDYLQRIPPPVGRYDRRDIEVSTIGRRLKALSVDLAAPVVAGAQIGRQAVNEGKDIPLKKPYRDSGVQDALRSRRPQLHHLREGGAEQEADLVLGLLNYRADFEEDATGDRRKDAEAVPEVTKLEMGTLKNRYGSPGRWAALSFAGRYGLVRDPRPEDEV